MWAKLIVVFCCCKYIYIQMQSWLKSHCARPNRKFANFSKNEKETRFFFSKQKFKSFDRSIEIRKLLRLLKTVSNLFLVLIQIEISVVSMHIAITITTQEGIKNSCYLFCSKLSKRGISESIEYSPFFFF